MYGKYVQWSAYCMVLQQYYYEENCLHLSPHQQSEFISTHTYHCCSQPTDDTDSNVTNTCSRPLPLLHPPWVVRGESDQERLEESCNSHFSFYDRNKGSHVHACTCTMYVYTCMCIITMYMYMYVQIYLYNDRVTPKSGSATC